jgi:UDP-N-acetylglucosamine acyltransferase
VEHGARISDTAVVGPYCVIGPDVEIGPGTRLSNGVTIQGITRIGRDNVISPYAVIGTAPQDLKYKGGDTRVVIGDRNTIREYVTVNLGTEKGGGVTSVGDDNLLMCTCHIAHDCHVGNGCIISNAVLLAGHITIGNNAVLSGAVALHHFVRVGECAFIGGMSRVVMDVPPFLLTEGDPAEARTVNVVGLRRQGFSAERIAALDDAFKEIFRSGVPMSQTLPKLLAAPPTGDVERLAAFLKARCEGKHGRANQP